MLRAQQNSPTKGDWLSATMTNISEMGINLSNYEIKHMKKETFHKMTKEKTEYLAFTNLIAKQQNGKKGRALIYEDKLKMADYLSPNDILNLEDQIEIFQVRSETNSIPANIGNPGPCPMSCGEILQNPHILTCKNIEETSESYEMLINGNLNEMKKALIAWRRNLTIIEQKTTLDSVY
jgi:hypothetical protein